MEKKNEGVKPKYTKFKAIKNIAIVIVVYFAVMISVQTLREVIGKVAFQGFFESSDANYLFVALANISLCFIVPILVKKNTNKSIRRYFYVRKLRLTDILMVFLAAYAIPRLVMHVEGLLLAGRVKVTENTSDTRTLIFFCSAVLIGPIAEEIILRYAMIEQMRKSFSKITILFVTALFFALLHDYTIQGFTCMFLSFIFVSVYYLRTGNLLFTILWHVLYNLITYVMDGRVFDTFWSSIYYVKDGFIIYRPVGLTGLIIMALTGILYYYLCVYQKSNKKLM